ncbi:MULTISPECIES: AI-2E family transporter [Delftia]|uniref:AI-2E family transporter n=1 Tax=Delftia TaxID=80865 RepID=UPI00135D3467|nr:MULTISPECIES: AI-2E family transporter [Delftia]MDH0773473.1 AI-2E family transporter [Delftia tsuruhatensis]MDH1457387.1 AI-2E family transporter [Delftia tsuruhatensis]MDH1823763.1 AI-2E family transporter [Delftia tsuruhatensis]MXN29962.1 AI-2E family transporter [Delftia sp. CH05]WGG08367.1 AI-2E family transporter [Delftia tsuruhatensis]
MNPHPDLTPAPSRKPGAENAAADAAGNAAAADAAFARSVRSALPGLAQLADMVPALRLLTGLLVASIIIAGLYFGQGLLIPLALALLFGFLLDPAVSRLRRWGLPRMAATLLVVVMALATLAGMGTYLGSQVQQLSADLPTYQSTIRDKLRSLRRNANMPSAWDGALRTYDTVEREISRGATTPRVQKVEIQSPEQKPTARMLQWLGRVAEPVTTAGIVLLFVILILLDRDDLRDRLLRLMGGNLHVATDALDEASQRIGKYLRMQFVVNITYGLPMAAGLWFIGVPGAILWGVLAAIMRFVPYVGAMISAAFPLALAFAVDPGWQMLLMTLGLIMALELISNNLIEPWLYGSSTGLSTLSIIAAATFWTALWGPIGLILSTPLTVCLLVLGRYIPALQFMEVLLGSSPVLGPAQRLYQRLLADDVEDAVTLAHELVDARLPARASADERSAAVAGFYDEVAIPALRLATQQHLESATAEHRLRLSSGMDALVEELRESHPAPADLSSRALRIHCVGARWEVDALAAAMVAHSEALRGHVVSCSDWALAADPQWRQLGQGEGGGLPQGHAGAQALAEAQLLVLSVFSAQPQTVARQIMRRVRRHWPHLRVVLALWNAPAVVSDPEFARRCGAAACVSSLRELQLWVDALRLPDAAGQGLAAPIPDDDEQRVRQLRDSGVLGPGLPPLYHEAAQQAANAFDVKWAQVSWVDADRVHTPGSLLVADQGDPASAGMPRGQSICSYVVHGGEPLVVHDAARDPRFAGNPALQAMRLRFYAGVPLRNRHGAVLGSFCIMDDAPREVSPADLELLAVMAEQLMQTVEVRRMMESGAVPAPAPAPASTSVPAPPPAQSPEQSPPGH